MDPVIRPRIPRSLEVGARDRLRDVNGNDALHRLIEAMFDPLAFVGVFVDNATVSETAAIADTFRGKLMLLRRAMFVDRRRWRYFS